VDLQLAAVAGAGVDMADGHGLAEHLEDVRVQFLLAGAQSRSALGAGSETMPVLKIFLQDQEASPWIARLSGRVAVCSTGRFVS
jgi:hypothetical protein